MKTMTTYQDTQGLSDFPKADQLSVYREAHKELMASNPVYRRSCRQFFTIICGLAILPVVPEILRLFHSYPDNGTGLLTVFLAGISLVLLLLTASLAQHYRNISIANFLKEKQTA